MFDFKQLLVDSGTIVQWRKTKQCCAIKALYTNQFCHFLIRCFTSVSPAGGGQALQCSNRNYSTHINDIDLTSCGLPDVTYPKQAQEAQKGHKDVVRVQQQQEPTCCQPQQAPCKSVSINSSAFNNFVLFQPYWSELVDF